MMVMVEVDYIVVDNKMIVEIVKLLVMVGFYKMEDILTHKVMEFIIVMIKIINIMLNVNVYHKLMPT